MAYTPNPDKFFGPAQVQPTSGVPNPLVNKVYSSNATSGEKPYVPQYTQAYVPPPAQSNQFSGQTLGITEKQATDKGLDWNKLPSGYTRSVPQPTGGKVLSEPDALRLGFDWNNLPSGYSRNVPQRQGPSQAEIDGQLNRSIDEAYNPQMGYLNEAEAGLRRDFPSIQAELQSQSAANSATLAANKQKAVSGLEKNIAGGKAKKEDALAQARRLYGGLQRGNNARFGGTSSAGAAVSEIQGQEFQRQAGSTERDFGRFMQDSNAQLQQIDTDFNAQSLQLETQKQTAINQAQRDFQSKLMEISRLKAETEGNKAMRRLQALQDLRNQVFTVNQQNTQFMQSLEQMKYQQTLEIQKQQQTMGGMQAPSYVPGNINMTRPGQTTSGQTASPYTGVTSNKPEDMYQGTVAKAYPVRQFLDGRTQYSDGSIK